MSENTRGEKETANHEMPKKGPWRKQKQKRAEQKRKGRTGEREQETSATEGGERVIFGDEVLIILRPRHACRLSRLRPGPHSGNRGDRRSATSRTYTGRYPDATANTSCNFGSLWDTPTAGMNATRTPTTADRTTPIMANTTTTTTPRVTNSPCLGFRTCDGNRSHRENQQVRKLHLCTLTSLDHWSHDNRPLAGASVSKAES